MAIDSCYSLSLHHQQGENSNQITGRFRFLVPEQRNVAQKWQDVL